MPIYEYQCNACGHTLEALQGINDAPMLECPECHKPDLAKLVSASSFQLKGTGWYATDFKNKTPPASSATANDQTTKTNETPGTKTPADTKTQDAANKDSSHKDASSSTTSSSKGAE